MKRFILFLIILSIPVIFAVGQSTELTVEESYLRQSVENMIIREQSRAESREMKMFALTYIGEAIEGGNRSDDVRLALEYMGLEGVLNPIRENGRLTNNFPDVRRESARYLGVLGTAEARDALLKMIYYDTEPMVLQEAVKSLGDIGLDDNGKTLDAIAWVFKKFDNTVPDNLLAFSAVEAVEKLAKSGGVRDPNTIHMLMRIIEGPYLRVVQDRARTVLSNIRRI